MFIALYLQSYSLSKRNVIAMLENYVTDNLVYNN